MSSQTNNLFQSVYETHTITINDGTLQEIIVKFDYSFLCSLDNNYLINVGVRLFAEKVVWRDRSLFYDAANVYANMSEFSVSCSGEYVHYSRYGNTHSWTKTNSGETEDEVSKAPSQHHDFYGG